MPSTTTPSKRKLEELFPEIKSVTTPKSVLASTSDRYMNSNIRTRSIVRNFETEFSHPFHRVSFVDLLATGDVCVVVDNLIYFYSDIFRISKARFLSAGLKEQETIWQPITTQLLLPSKEISLSQISSFDVAGGDCRKEMLLGTCSGSILIWQLPSGNSKSETFTISVALVDGDFIVDVRSDGNRWVLLTAFSEVVSFNRTGSQYILQRSRSLFSSILSTGAKLLGIAGAGQYAGNMLKLVPLPAFDLVVCIGSTLTIWSSYQTNGEEKVLLESKLTEALKSDLSEFTSVGPVQSFRIRLCDACVLESSVSSESMTLLVLSAVVPQDSAVNEDTDSIASLWLHSVTIKLSKSVSADFFRSLEVDFRMFVSDGVLIPAGTREHQQPRLFAMPPTWRIFLSWIMADTSSLNTAQIDILSHRGGGPDGVLRCDSARDTGLTSTAVKCMRTVREIDGISALISDDMGIAVICPPLPADFSKAQAQAQAPLVDRDRERLCGLEVKLAKPQILDVLASVATGKLDIDAAMLDLRNTFVSWTVEDIVDVISQASERILNRSAVGQFWGAGLYGIGNAAGNLLNEFQLAYKLVKEKQDSHSRLIEAVLEADGFRFESVKKRLLSNHLSVLLCSGLSESLQDSQTRGGSNAEREAVQLLTASISTVVQQNMGQSLESLQSRGLSVFDHFYARVEGFTENLVAVLNLSIASADSKDPAVVFQLLSVFLSTVNFALLQIERLRADEDHLGESLHPLSDSSLRDALARLCQCLLRRIRATPFEQVSTCFTEAREGKKLTEFAELLLQAFHGASDGSASEHRQTLQTVKEWTIDTLVALKFHGPAFSLSAKYLYFHGLFEAADLSPDAHSLALERIIAEKSTATGTDTTTLGLKYLTWLEDKERSQEILNADRIAPGQLDVFLSSRPQLSWIHHIQRGEYESAARTGFEHSTQLAAAGDAITMLSIAKLCSVLQVKAVTESLDGLKPPVPSPERQQERRGTERGTDRGAVRGAHSEEFKALFDRIGSEHDLLSIQQSLSLPPLAGGSVADARLSAISLAAAIAQILADDSGAAVSPAELPSLAAKALAALGIAMKMSTGTSAREDALGVVDRLWRSVIQRDQDMILDLCLPALVTKSEEAKIRDGSSLYKAMRAAVRGLDEGSLSSGLVPLQSDRLTLLVDGTTLPRRRIGEDGSLESIPDGRPDNARVRLIANAVVDLAVKDQRS